MIQPARESLREASTDERHFWAALYVKGQPKHFNRVIFMMQDYPLGETGRVLLLGAFPGFGTAGDDFFAILGGVGIT